MKTIMILMALILCCGVAFAAPSEIFIHGVVRNATNNSLYEGTQDINITLLNGTKVILSQTKASQHIDDGVYHTVFTSMVHSWFLTLTNFTIKIGSVVFPSQQFIPVPIAHAAYVANDSLYLNGQVSSFFLDSTDAIAINNSMVDNESIKDYIDTKDTALDNGIIGNASFIFTNIYAGLGGNKTVIDAGIDGNITRLETAMTNNATYSNNADLAINNSALTIDTITAVNDSMPTNASIKAYIDAKDNAIDAGIMPNITANNQSMLQYLLDNYLNLTLFLGNNNSIKQYLLDFYTNLTLFTNNNNSLLWYIDTHYINTTQQDNNNASMKAYVDAQDAAIHSGIGGNITAVYGGLAGNVSSIYTNVYQGIEGNNTIVYNGLQGNITIVYAGLDGNITQTYTEIYAGIAGNISDENESMKAYVDAQPKGNTTQEIINIINNSEVTILCKNINFSGTIGSASICDGDDVAGGGGAGMWVDAGTYINPNSTYASNIKVFGYIQADDWSNASGVCVAGDAAINASALTIATITAVNITMPTNASIKAYIDVKDAAIDNGIIGNKTEVYAGLDGNVSGVKTDIYVGLGSNITNVNNSLKQYLIDGYANLTYFTANNNSLLYYLVTHYLNTTHQTDIYNGLDGNVSSIYTNVYAGLDGNVSSIYTNIYAGLGSNITNVKADIYTGLSGNKTVLDAGIDGNITAVKTVIYASLGANISRLETAITNNATKSLNDDIAINASALTIATITAVNITMPTNDSIKQYLLDQYTNLTLFTANNNSLSDLNGSYDALNVTCTDCVGTNQITDTYLFNTGDTCTGDYIFDNNVTMEGIIFEKDTTNHKMYDNATCIIIKGDSSELHIC